MGRSEDILNKLTAFSEERYNHEEAKTETGKLEQQLLEMIDGVEISSRGCKALKEYFFEKNNNSIA